MRLTLCLLTWNEAEGVRQDMPRLPLEAFDEVFAVDGGSRDGTVDLLQAHGITVHTQRRRSLNAAYHEAFARFTTDAIVFFHPKGSIDPAEVGNFRALFAAGNELVVASRMLPGARNEEDAHLLRPRKWFVHGLSLLAALRWRREGARVTDVLHGFRGVTRGAIERMRLTETGTTMDLELVIQAYALRLPRAEFPVRESARAHGVSHFKAWPTGKELLRFYAAEALRPLRRRLGLELLADRYPALHGLRVLAILGIIVFHVDHGLTPDLVALKRHLWFPMDLFFVLSGFLIGGILLAGRRSTQPRELARFYVRRFMRTVPPYYATLLVLAAIGGFALTAAQSGNLWRELLFLTNYPAGPGLYLMDWSWSLSVEEHFYLLSPFLAALCLRLPRGTRMPLALAAFLTPLALRLATEPVVADSWEFFEKVYTPTHLRFDTFLAGFFLAYVLRFHAARAEALMAMRGAPALCLAAAVTLVGTAGASFTVVSDTHGRGGALCVGTLTSLGYVCLILWALHGRGRLIDWLGSRAMRALATLGYGVYLIHLAVIIYLVPLLPKTAAGWTAAVLMTTALSFVYAYALHQLVEKPVLALRDRLAAPAAAADAKRQVVATLDVTA